MAKGEGMFELDRQTGKWFDAGNPSDPNNPKNQQAPAPPPPPAPAPVAHHEPSGHHGGGGGGGGGGPSAYEAELLSMINDLYEQMAQQSQQQQAEEPILNALTTGTRLASLGGRRGRVTRGRTYLTPIPTTA